MDWQSSMKANRKEGITIGREEERKKTIYEKKRADEAEERAKQSRRTGKEIARNHRKRTEYLLKE